MGHAAGQPADRLHLLRLQTAPPAAAFGHVAGRHGDAVLDRHHLLPQPHRPERHAVQVDLFLQRLPRPHHGDVAVQQAGARLTGSSSPRRRPWTCSRSTPIRSAPWRLRSTKRKSSTWLLARGSTPAGRRRRGCRSGRRGSDPGWSAGRAWCAVPSRRRAPPAVRWRSAPGDGPGEDLGVEQLAVAGAVLPQHRALRARRGGSGTPAAAAPRRAGQVGQADTHRNSARE